MLYDRPRSAPRARLRPLAAALTLLFLTVLCPLSAAQEPDNDAVPARSGSTASASVDPATPATSTTPATTTLAAATLSDTTPATTAPITTLPTTNAAPALATTAPATTTVPATTTAPATTISATTTRTTTVGARPETPTESPETRPKPTPEQEDAPDPLADAAAQSEKPPKLTPKQDDVPEPRSDTGSGSGKPAKPSPEQEDAPEPPVDDGAQSEKPPKPSPEQKDALEPPVDDGAQSEKPPKPSPEADDPAPAAKPANVDIMLDLGGATVPPGAKKGRGKLAVNNYARARGVPRTAMQTSAEGMQFALSFDVPAGSYRVELAFAEHDALNCRKGARVFNVHINDEVQLEAFDVFEMAGACGRAVLQTFETQIDSVIRQPLSIRFDSVAGLASVSFVRVRTSPQQCVPELGNRQVRKGQNHLAHAVPGSYPHVGRFFVDNAGKGFRDVRLDGRRSHSHMFDAVTKRSGVIRSYLWTDADSGKELSRKARFTLRAKLGATRVRLHVVDNGCSTDEAETTITVTGREQQGAYCYYYAAQPDLLDAGTLEDPIVRPMFAQAASMLDLGFPTFPGHKGLFSMRCIFSVATREADETPLLLDTFGTGDATLYKGPDLVVDSRTATNGSTVTADGLTPFELVYRRTDGAKPPRLRLTVGGSVPSGNALSYDQSLVLPIVTKIAPTALPEAGGARVRIYGYGLFEPLTVRFGDVVARVYRRDSAPWRLFVQAPPGTGVAKVTVTSGAKLVSNEKTMRYGSGCADAVAFERRVLGNAKGHINQPTSAEIWQDGKLYIGTRLGTVIVVDYDTETLAVTSSCGSDVLLDPRFEKDGKPAPPHILGVTFDPRDTVGRPYVSCSILFWATEGKIDASNTRRWSNGAVIRLKPADAASRAQNPKRCLVKDRTVVRNLPVSGSDHGVNDLLFTQDGDLLIGVGGMTNAGFPYHRVSGTWEAKLSGAVLIAHLSRPGFDGDVAYDDPDNMRVGTPATSDVEPYAVGLRNAFRLMMRRNGEIYALENGPNCGYGNATYACSEYNETAAAARDIRAKDVFPAQVDTTRGGRCKDGVYGPDKVVRLTRGAFYGHPNLQRGGDECTWINPYSGRSAPPKETRASARYRAPLLTGMPAMTGLIEYGAQHFCGALRGELVLARYKGLVTERIRLVGRNGATVAQKPERLFSFGGLRNVENERGDIIFPKLHAATLVARPRVSDEDDLFIANVLPFRFGAGGGGRMRIGGRGFDTADDIRVSVGGNDCKVRSVSAVLIVCSVPPGKPGSQADVLVAVGLDEAVASKAVLYMNV